MAPDSLAVQKRREDAARSLWEWLDRLVWTLRAVTFEDATTYRHGVEKERAAMDMVILMYAGMDALIECERGR